MSRKTVFTTLALCLALVLGACRPASSTQEAMMDTTPAEAGMEAMPDTGMTEAAPTAMMMEETPTPKGMMEAMPTEAMLEESATSDTMMEAMPTEAMLEESTTPDTMMEGTPEAMMEAPAWFGAALTDAVTGETFHLEDFEGKVVLVELMAVWCTTCRAQQGEIVALHEQLGMPDDLVTLSLDIDPNENQDDLKAYVEQNGFEWPFAVAGTEVAREIGMLYGDQFINPPSAPVLIIDRHGQAHPLGFGVKSAGDLAREVNVYLDEKM
jgi:thiol-disulfide isomerase/thioredoxin